MLYMSIFQVICELFVGELGFKMMKEQFVVVYPIVRLMLIEQQYVQLFWQVQLVECGWDVVMTSLVVHYQFMVCNEDV